MGTGILGLRTFTQPASPIAITGSYLHENGSSPQTMSIMKILAANKTLRALRSNIFVQEIATSYTDPNHIGAGPFVCCAGVQPSQKTSLGDGGWRVRSGC